MNQQQLSPTGNTSEEILSKLIDDLAEKNVTPNISIGRSLSYGESADIYHGVYINQIHGSNLGDVTDVVIKTFRPPRRQYDAKYFKRISREIRIWTQCQHRNILPLIGFTMKDLGGGLLIPSLVSKYMERGSLRDALDRKDEMDIKIMVEGIASGLLYLHENRGIIHADLKSPNVVLSPEGDPLLMDFGLSHMRSTTTRYAETATSAGWGSTPWMAPEQFGSALGTGEDQIHTKESDIWALGMVFYEILTKHFPYYPETLSHRIIIKISDGELPSVPDVDERDPATNHIWDLCFDCWKREPGERPKIRDIDYRLAAKHKVMKMKAFEHSTPQSMRISRRRTRQSTIRPFRTSGGEDQWVDISPVSRTNSSPFLSEQDEEDMTPLTQKFRQPWLS